MPDVVIVGGGIIGAACAYELASDGASVLVLEREELAAGASAAYLTVSETWPIEIRAEAIAVFFAIGSVAGALGPAFYGA
ncbi:MAG: FAD-dependent oxidoreductase, partial [Actinomycetota bacterium]